MTNNSIRELNEMTGARYINPYTDFGFKKLFGTPLNKELLISFLNSLFEGKEVISDLTYLNGENLGDSYGDFYSTFAIQNQGKKGIWDFNLKGVYTVAILDFVFPDNEYPDDSLRHEVKLVDVDDKHVFYDKLTFLYLEMPKFTKTEDELETMYDKWLFVLHNLSCLMKRPAALQEHVFTRLFEQAEIARYSPKERQKYEDSLKVYRDLRNVIDTAELKGQKKGFEQGSIEERKKIEKTMKALHMSLEDISKATGMSIDELAGL